MAPPRPVSGRAAGLDYRWQTQQRSADVSDPDRAPQVRPILIACAGEAALWRAFRLAVRRYRAAATMGFHRAVQAAHRRWARAFLEDAP